MKKLLESIKSTKKDKKINILKVVVLSVLLALLFYLYLASVETVLTPALILVAIIAVLFSIWEKWARNLGILVTVLFFVYFFQQISNLLFPFIAAFIIAILFSPLIDFAERKRIPRTLAVIILFLILFAAIVGVLTFIIPQIVDQTVLMADKFTNLPDPYEYISEKTTILQGYLDDPRIAPYAAPIIDMISEKGNELFAGIFEGVIDVLASAGSLASGLLNIILIPIISFYLLRDLPKIKKFVKSVIPPAHLDWVAELYHDIDGVIGGYLRGQSTVVVMEATFMSIALTAIGIENALLLGIFAGLCNIIPYVGYVLALVPVIVVGLFSPENALLKTGLAVGVFVVIQFIDGNIIAPRILGKQVGVHPVMVMIGILAGAKFFGILGVILAVPTMGVVRVLAHRAYDIYITSDIYTKGGAALTSRDDDADEDDDPEPTLRKE
ncbi:MAG: AI-2E family transporter [bacterium]|nr:AI-2E family transporter [bacterium]